MAVGFFQQLFLFKQSKKSCQGNTNFTKNFLGDFMETISSFIGTDIYCDGTVIGKITDLSVDIHKKTLFGLQGIKNYGLIREKFFVDKSGILHLDRNGAVIKKSAIKHKKFFGEEYGRSNFDIFKNNDFYSGSVGDFYIEAATMEILGVSVKQSFLDDLIFGREIVNIDNISLTDKGLVIINRE